MISPSACSRIVEAYDAQGWHRTGTEVDAASAQWLLSELGTRGVMGEIQSFPISRVDPDQCLVSAGDWQVPGYPLLDSRLPPRGTRVSGIIAETPGPGKIALVRTDGHGQTSTLDQVRREAWDAIVALVDGEGLTVRNAWHVENPIGPPIVQVPAAALPQLLKARASSTPVSVICGAERAAVLASNVVATVSGRDDALPPIVVLTPRSGWWHCAGERGGGIAVWLEVAREVRQLGLERTVAFVATTGHELGFWGIRRHLERAPHEGAAAHFWVHLGANIGARESPTVVRSADDELLRLAGDADATIGESAVNPDRELRAEPPGGEAQVVAASGGRYLSLVGRGFELFHSSEDRWPDAIDSVAIARNASLVLECIRQSEPGFPEHR